MVELWFEMFILNPYVFFKFKLNNKTKILSHYVSLKRIEIDDDKFLGILAVI